MDAVGLIYTFGMRAINAKDRRISELELAVESMQMASPDFRFLNLKTGEATFAPPKEAEWCTMEEAARTVRECRVKDAWMKSGGIPFEGVEYKRCTAPTVSDIFGASLPKTDAPE